jgi:hypothetical protein
MENAVKMWVALETLTARRVSELVQRAQALGDAEGGSSSTPGHGHSQPQLSRMMEYAKLLVGALKKRQRQRKLWGEVS